MIDAIIDISHHNGTSLDFVAAARGGIVAVINKASQGTSYLDPSLAVNRTKASTAGLRFGCYHFGTGADGIAQAQFFLDQTQPGDLLALDFEANTTGPSMTLEQARAFVTAIHDRIQKWPVLYAGRHLKDLLGTTPDPVLAQCPLWIAQYGPSVVLPAGWSGWKLWQWTDGTVGAPDPINGVGQCDRDRFSGTIDELPAFWDSVSMVSLSV